MPIVSSILWVLGLVFSVVMAPQLRIWTWGPAMLCFSASVLFAVPGLWSGGLFRANRFILISGLAMAAWLALRAAFSPVAELALADLLLTAMAVSTFVALHNAFGSRGARNILIGGIALLLLASLAVIAKQVQSPGYMPVFSAREDSSPSGFFAHYSYGASFLIPTALLIAAFAIHSSLPRTVRLIFFFIALFAVVGIFLTRSRGGWIGFGGGLLVFVIYSIMAAKRENRKWSGPLLVLAPILFLGIAAWVVYALSSVQEARGAEGLTAMLDNTIRFYLLGIAASCIGLHPFLGGGSRSFSWECFQFWDARAFGRGNAKPEHVHNEFIQTITDYGILGGGLLAILILCVFFFATFKTISKGNRPSPDRSHADAWRVGGIAGLAGLLVQSNFEGIFRIPPGAVMLAVCLAAASYGFLARDPRKTEKPRFALSLLTVSSVAAALTLAFYGWKATAATAKLWPTYFSPAPVGEEARISAFTRALDHWNLATLRQERALLYHRLAAEADTPGEAEDLLRLALDGYLAAAGLHPFHPGHRINAAGICRTLGLQSQALSLLRDAVRLQGGLESAFGANHRYADFLHHKAVAEFDPQAPLPAIKDLRTAARHIEKAFELTLDHSRGREGRKLRADIHISLGIALETAAEYEKALESYDFAARLRSGNSANHHASVMLGKRAVAVWSQRRGSDALRLFMEAEKRSLDGGRLPPGIGGRERAQYRRYLRSKIEFLEGARFEPSARINLE